MTEEKALEQRPLWVFGYASLLWNPGFPVAEQRLATLQGYHRSFCMRSIHHRGTEEAPGLVLALDARLDAECHGLALRVEDGSEVATVAYLRERELISSAYVERLVPLTLENGETVTALAYVIDADHVQYVADLSLEEQAQIITHAVGGRGPNPEYLWNTADHLRTLGVEDTDLDWLSERVRILSKTPE
ncbi:gamma-glutamylcyclotransferase [Rhodobacteraceae bacterium]|nr:gamma-glutamylcyclotransferase [Paracoccaceae bacterium]